MSAIVNLARVREIRHAFGREYEVRFIPKVRIEIVLKEANVDAIKLEGGTRVAKRIKAIVDELSGEKVDIIRWSDDPEAMVKKG